MSAIEALFASLNPFETDVDRLNQNLARAIDLVASRDNYSLSAQRAIYGGLASAFDRVARAEKGQHVALESGSLTSILFDTNLETEGLRLLRADAIVAVCKSTPGLRLNFQGRIVTLTKDEVSPAVRDRLGASGG